MSISAINNSTASLVSSNASPVATHITSAPSMTTVLSMPTPSNTNPSEQAAAPALSDVNRAVKSLNNFTSALNTGVSFNVDHSSGTLVIRIVDNNTQQLIRQIPSEQVLASAQIISNNTSSAQTGVLIHNIA